MDYTKSQCVCMSDYIDKFIVAYSAAKAACETIQKSGSNQGRGYAKYEDLSRAIIPACREKGLEIIHMRYPLNEKEVMCTRIIHRESGQWMQDVRYAESEKPGNQGKGAADTYSKRYALLALFGWPDNEDDDGQSEQDHIATEDAAPITQEQLTELQSAIKACSNGNDLYRSILGKNSVKDLVELSVSEFKGAMFYVNNYGKPKQ